jgi:hypothetical protein
MKQFQWIIASFGVLAFAGLLQAAPPALTYQAGRVDISVENGTYGQIFDWLKQQAGMTFEVPGEFRNQVLPLVSLRQMVLRDALVEILEGSDYDYILIGAPGNPANVRQLIITGKSMRTASSSSPGTPVAANTMPIQRFRRNVQEDPFSGAPAEDFDDGSNLVNETSPMNAPPNMNTPQPVPANQGNFGAGPVMGPSGSPGMSNPMQMQQGLPGTQFGNPQNQMMGNPNLNQPYPANQNQNIRRTPF